MKWNIEAVLTYCLLDQAFRIFFSIEFSIGLATAAFFFKPCLFLFIDSNWAVYGSSFCLVQYK